MINLAETRFLFVAFVRYHSKLKNVSNIYMVDLNIPST